MKKYTFDYGTKTNSHGLKADISTAIVSLNTIMLLAIADKCRKHSYRDCILAITAASGVFNPKYKNTPSGKVAEDNLAELDGALARLAKLCAKYGTPYSYEEGVVKTEEIHKQIERVERKLDDAHHFIELFYSWAIAQDESAYEVEDDEVEEIL